MADVLKIFMIGSVERVSGSVIRVSDTTPNCGEHIVSEYGEDALAVYEKMLKSTRAKLEVYKQAEEMLEREVAAATRFANLAKENLPC